MVCYKEVLSLKKKKHEGEREGREMEKGYAYNSDGGGTQAMTQRGWLQGPREDGPPLWRRMWRRPVTKVPVGSCKNLTLLLFILKS